jgi:hypothetical protein
MTIEHLPHSTNALPIVKSEGSECRTVASCKRKRAAYAIALPPCFILSSVGLIPPKEFKGRNDTFRMGYRPGIRV